MTGSDGITDSEFARTRLFEPLGMESTTTYAADVRDVEKHGIAARSPMGPPPLNGSRAFEFAPVDRDTSQRGMMTLRFRRDRDGKVVALDYSNPGLRNITFTRLSDGTSGR